MTHLRALAVCSLALVTSPALAQKGKSKPVAAPAPGVGVSVEASQLFALKARAIGPAIMGGRVTEIALDPRDAETFYVAYATAGLFKTTDNGFTFEPLFEKETVASVGAVAVAPSDPDVVWVGTGEADDRNSASWGNGVYRSTDGGGSWTRAGLPGSRAIARLLVHPKDAATAWAAVSGDLWSPSKERGLFKTTDAGKSWSKVLGAASPHDGETGCVDVVLDPSNPDVLYAALYARRRTPWSFTYGPELTGGADSGGIFKSSDGGATWKKLTKGLPGRSGRIGLDIARGNPKVVYAVVQSDEAGTSSIDELKSRKGGIFRSEDGGESFTRMNGLNPRPFYFSQVRVDPLNDKRVYVLGYMLHVSDDGGRSFREDLFQKVHADCHALAISGSNLSRPDPKEKDKDKEPPKPPVSKRLLLGTDGGVYQSFQGGGSWAHLANVATGQFYRINADDSTPYRICGGLQDNTNWVGPSRTYTKDGITNSDWTQIGGGDGFYCVFDPLDRDVLYAESQGGELHRISLRTGERKVLQPRPAEGQTGFRFHWNSPLIGSRHKKGTVYLAGNRVFRLSERAEEFTAISPDLTGKDPERILTTGSGAENYAVVYTLAESPLKAGLLWAGTDDGKLWLTEDDGGRWSDLTASLPAAVKGQWINRVEPGHQDAAVAYLAVDGHRTGNLAPLAYRTADGGRSWQSIAGNLPPEGPVKVVREDPKNPNLLFAGTEFGLFASLDRGATWVKLGHLPTVAVDDLLVHEKEHDLVIATHGRSLYVLDDITPLRELSAEALASDIHLFPPREAFGRYLLDGWEESAGKALYRGDNPEDGVAISYWVKGVAEEPLKIDIKNAEGQPVATFKPAPVPGLGRVHWNLRPTKDHMIEYGGLGKEKLVKAGDYTVTLSRGEKKTKQTLKVRIAEGIETR